MTSGFVCINGTWTMNGEEIETFPVQDNRRDRAVPRDVAEAAYCEYAAQYGTAQTLDRLGERGGFGSSELAVLLYERIQRIEAAVAKAARGIRGEMADETQGASETLGKIDMRVAELADVLPVAR